MSERESFEVQRGETHRVRISSPVGSSFVATSAATLHLLRGGINSSSPDTAVAATYQVSDYLGDTARGPGFDFVLADTVTDDLAPGAYIAAPLITYSAPEAFVDVPLAWTVIVKSYPS
jgi:hypothetical protein